MLHIKLAKDSLNNIFQDSFNIILSEQLTHDRFYISLSYGYRINTVHRIIELSSNLFNPLPDDKSLDWSQLRRIADIFKCI